MALLTVSFEDVTADSFSVCVFGSRHLFTVVECSLLHLLKYCTWEQIQDVHVLYFSVSILCNFKRLLHYISEADIILFTSYLQI